MGTEEIREIGPGVAQARAEGMNVSGPFPADTVFIAASRGEYDAVVTMYHDQGQIATKLLACPSQFAAIFFNFRRLAGVNSRGCNA
jgi:4-hydroxy-L-threonine phosphate dehydrogenase PdxA